MSKYVLERGPSRRMKIYVVEPRGSGGMAHYAYQLCNAFCAHAATVTLITSQHYELERYPRRFRLQNSMALWDQHSSTPAALQENRVKRLARTAYRKARRVFRGARLLAAWVQVTRQLLKERPDVVQFGSIEFPFEAIFLKILKSRGLTLTQICHEFEQRERAQNLLVRVNNALLSGVFQNFAAMFFHSQSNIDRFRELYPDVPPERFHLIPMGNEQIFPTVGDGAGAKAALAGRYGLAQGEKVVLFFGTLTPSKGVPDLLRAFALVRQQNRQARLVVAGMPLKFIDAGELYRLTAELGIEPYTCFDSRYLPMEEVGPLMELADVVVFPYKNATQSGSIQTAYAFGKPVVATRVGGLPDVVVDGESGFLVEPGEPEQIAAAVLNIINHAERAEAMGRYARHLSETRFAWEPIAGRIVSVYQDLLQGIL